MHDSRQILEKNCLCNDTMCLYRPVNFKILQGMVQILVKMPVGGRTQKYFVPMSFLQINGCEMRLIRLFIFSPWEMLQHENFSLFRHLDILTGERQRNSTCRKSFDRCLHVIRTQKTLLLGTNLQKNQSNFICLWLQEPLATSVRPHQIIYLT